MVEDVLAAPASKAEKAAAQERHANILQLCFHNQFKAGQFEDAKAFMDHLVTTYPASYLVNNITRTWAQHRKQTCAKYLQAGALTEAKSILDELTQNGWFFGDTRVLEDYQKRSVDRH